MLQAEREASIKGRLTCTKHLRALSTQASGTTSKWTLRDSSSVMWDRCQQKSTCLHLGLACRVPSLLVVAVAVAAGGEWRWRRVSVVAARVAPVVVGAVPVVLNATLQLPEEPRRKISSGPPEQISSRSSKTKSSPQDYGLRFWGCTGKQAYRPFVGGEKSEGAIRTSTIQGNLYHKYVKEDIKGLQRWDEGSYRK